MNKDWSESLKQALAFIDRIDTFDKGIARLIALREEVFGQITSIVRTYPAKAFPLRPFPNVKGYHCKTLAYSIWHIFRIEDIVAHTLLKTDTQVFFANDYDKSINASIITTGNELHGEEISLFSEALNIGKLYEYAQAVKESTNDLLRSLSYSDLKRRFTDEDRLRLTESHCVSTDPDAYWLIDYWCGKNVRGLLGIPFGRHWIMHVEAMQRIKNRLCKQARKGVDPIAYCGFSCNHCFLGEWCGSCRTAYNTCSFATLFPDNRCPNLVCCQEKNLDGCFECPDLRTCEKGFYAPSSDGAAAAKSQAMFIQAHGKKELLKLQDRLHEKYDFAKAQEILGHDAEKAFQMLEDVYNR